MRRLRRAQTTGRSIVQTGKVPHQGSASLTTLTLPKCEPVYKPYTRLFKDRKMEEAFPDAGKKGIIPHTLRQVLPGHGKVTFFSESQADISEFLFNTPF